MKNQHTLFVCKTCASVWKDGQRIGKSGGELLLDQITQLYQNWQLAPEFSLQSVECMSACDRPCVVALAATGKLTYLFGDLSANVETLHSTSTAILKCASQYYEKPDGTLPWAERPQPLRKGILAKIPPLSQYLITRWA